MEDVQTVDLPYESDSRGCLTYIQEETEIPFDIERVFYIYDVPPVATRGEHAHKRTEQLLVAVNGAATVTTQTKPTADAKQYRLDAANKGLYVPQQTWIAIDAFNEDTVVLVLASERYDPDEYIEELEQLR